MREPGGGKGVTVVEMIADYAEMRVSQFLIHGFDPLADAEAYCELVSLGALRSTAVALRDGMASSRKDDRGDRINRRH